MYEQGVCKCSSNSLCHTKLNKWRKKSRNICTGYITALCSCTRWKIFLQPQTFTEKNPQPTRVLLSCGFIHFNAALTSQTWQEELVEHCLEGFMAGMKRPPAWSLMKHYHYPSLFRVKPLPGAISSTAIYTTLAGSSVIHRGLPEEETNIFQILIRTLLQWTSTGSCINNWSPSN